MLTVTLSDKPCVICNSKENTVLAKCKEQDFQGIICTTHLISLLKKWEGKDVPAKSFAGS